MNFDVQHTNSYNACVYKREWNLFSTRYYFILYNKSYKNIIIHIIGNMCLCLLRKYKTEILKQRNDMIEFGLSSNLRCYGCRWRGKP